MDNPIIPNQPQNNEGSPQPPSPREIEEQQKQKIESNEAAQKLSEFEAMQEQISKVAPSQPQTAVSNVPGTPMKNDDNQKAANEAAQAETQQPESDEVSVKDLSWVQKAEDVIEKDKDKPYQEEEDAEKLRQEYLDKRFNFEVDTEEDKK